MENDKNSPIVTVGVCAYNSADTIVETLESIKKQTYPNIELIISDDSSSDTTVDICKKWLNNNASNFVNTKLIEVKQNTGTAGNANRILTKANGLWLKLIGADDILPANSISDYISYSIQHTNMMAAFADELDFLDNFEGKPIEYHSLDLKNSVFGKNATAKWQYKVFSKRILGLGPTFFAKTELLKEMGGYDERFPLIEDTPLMIKITKSGTLIHHIPKPLVYYRIRSNSVSHSSEKKAILSKCTILAIKEYKLLYFKENQSWLWKLLLSYSIWLNLLIVKCGNRADSQICKVIFFIKKLTDPMDWYSRWTNLVDKLYS